MKLGRFNEERVIAILEVRYAKEFSQEEAKFPLGGNNFRVG